jgi:digeranylgeranylglycerophospholipid reductase
MAIRKSDIYSCEVVVIGAGIVGCHAASELARIGYDVCVLEKNPQAGTKSVCTGIISKECLDLIPVGRRALQHEAFSARIFSPTGKNIRVERKDPQAFVLDRASLDRIIAEQARKNGACMRFSTFVSSIVSGDRSVLVTTTKGNDTSVIEAKIAVIACGAGSSLTRSTGLGQVHDYAHGAQIELPVRDLNEVEVYSGTDIAPGFFAWLVPTDQQLAKVGLLCRKNAGHYMNLFLSGLRGEGRIDGENPEIRYGIVPLRPLARTYGARLLVVGDAAGQVKPTTGGGIYFGLLCANLAVQTIDEALKASDFSIQRLAAYQKRWHRLLKQELSIDYWAHRFYQGLNNKQIEHIFNIIERHAIHESILASPDITFDWHGKVILDALKYRSLQRSLEKLGLAPAPSPNRRA